MAPKPLVIKSRGSRWGDGKVHYPRGYDNKMAHAGYALCGVSVYGSAEPESTTPVDCIRCINRDNKLASGG